MQQKIEKAVKDLMLIILLSLSFLGFTLQTFILKTNVVIYLIAMFVSALLFATSLKNLKLGLIYIFATMFIGAFLTWGLIIFPPLTLGESALVNYTTEVFLYYAARYVLLCIPVMLLGVIIGSILVDAI